MDAYLEEVRKLEKRFLGMGLHHVPRSENKEADTLPGGCPSENHKTPASLRSDSYDHPQRHLHQPRSSLAPFPRNFRSRPSRRAPTVGYPLGPA